MKKDTLKALVQSDDLWRWAERNGPQAEAMGQAKPEERWWQKWFPRKSGKTSVTLRD